MDPLKPMVAVIGAGPAGLASLKYLRHEGFRVTVFERRPDVGGVWTFSDDPHITSTTPCTRSQVSKYTSCMTDFPFPEDSPTYLTAPLWAEYYKSYAKHFDLYPHIEFNVSVKLITRDNARNQWAVHLRGEEQPRMFDRVVLATGTENAPQYPKIEGLDSFEGRFLHAQAYKGPDEFKGKNVVVIGQGASAGDTCVGLADSSNVYFSHRRGVKIIPRMAKDGPLDGIINFRFTRFLGILEHYLPYLYGVIADREFYKSMERAWGKQDPAWGFEPSPSIRHGISAAMINDSIIPLIREGKIYPVTGVKRIRGPKEVELTDGKVLEKIDVIIACTGYQPHTGLIPDIPATVLDSRVPPIPDLYQNMFSIKYADSLACLHYCAIAENAATYREIMAMAVAQVWTGKSKLPSEDEMRADLLDYQQWFTRKKLEFPAIYMGIGRTHTFLRFIHDAAGTGVNEYLGWGWKGWKLWWTDRDLYNLAVWGIYSPHIYRLLETGKRPVWEGAREALVRVNEMYRRDFGKGGKEKKN